MIEWISSGTAYCLPSGPLRRLPVGGPEVARLDARGGEFIRGDRAQRAGRDAERHAQFMIGHDVRALADGRRGLHLGVERHAPFERGRIDLDLARVLLVELVEHRLHADAVAAAEKVPPDDGFRRPAPRRPSTPRWPGSRTRLCGSSRLPPKNDLAASRPLGARFRNCAFGKPCLGMVARKTRGAKRFQSMNLILNFADEFLRPPPRSDGPAGWSSSISLAKGRSRPPLGAP